MSDLISRQDTIDRINEYIEEYSEIDSDGNHSEKWCAMQEAKMTIENMPPTQPEIIRCKDCKWKNRHNCTRAVEVPIDDDKYCAWAERRTDETD